jgi:hypothetical protein
LAPVRKISGQNLETEKCGAKLIVPPGDVIQRQRCPDPLVPTAGEATQGLAADVEQEVPAHDAALRLPGRPRGVDQAGRSGGPCLRQRCPANPIATEQVGGKKVAGGSTLPVTIEHHDQRGQRRQDSGQPGSSVLVYDDRAWTAIVELMGEVHAMVIRVYRYCDRAEFVQRKDRDDVDR